MKSHCSWCRILLVGLLVAFGLQTLGCFFLGGPKWEMKDQKAMLSPEPGQAEAARSQLRADLIAYMTGQRPELGHPPEAVAIYALHQLENGKDADAYALFSIAGYLSKKTANDYLIKAMGRLGMFSQQAIDEANEFMSRSSLHNGMNLLDLLKKLRFASQNRAVVRELLARKSDLKEGEKISYPELKEITKKIQWYQPEDADLASAVVKFFSDQSHLEDASMASWALLYASKIPEKRLLRTLVEGPRKPLFPAVIFGIVSWGKQVIKPLVSALDEKNPEQTANTLVALALLEARQAEPQVAAAVGSSSILCIRQAYSFYRMVLGLDQPETFLSVLKEAEKNLTKSEKKRDEITKSKQASDAEKEEARKQYWKDHEALDQGMSLLELLVGRGKITSVPTFFLINVMQHNHGDFWESVAGLMIRLQIKLSDDEFDLVVSNLKQIRVGWGGKNASAPIKFGMVLSRNKEKLSEIRQMLGSSSGRDGQRLALFWALGQMGEDQDFAMMHKEFKPSLKGYGSGDRIKEILAFNQAIVVAAGTIGCAECRSFLLKTARENPVNLGRLASQELLKFSKDSEVSGFLASADVSMASEGRLQRDEQLRQQAVQKVLAGLNSKDFEQLNEATSLARMVAAPEMKPAVERLLVYEGEFPRDKYIRNDAIELMASIILSAQGKEGSARLREVISVIDTTGAREAGMLERRAKLEKALKAAEASLSTFEGTVDAATKMAQGAESGSLGEDEAKAMVHELIKSAERTTESVGATAGGEGGAAAEQRDKAGAGADAVKADAEAARKAQCEQLVKELKEVKAKCDTGKKIYCEAFGEKRDEFIKKCGEELLPAGMTK